MDTVDSWGLRQPEKKPMADQKADPDLFRHTPDSLEWNINLLTDIQQKLKVLAEGMRSLNVEELMVKGEGSRELAITYLERFVANCEGALSDHKKARSRGLRGTPEPEAGPKKKKPAKD